MTKKETQLIEAMRAQIDALVVSNQEQATRHDEELKQAKIKANGGRVKSDALLISIVKQTYGDVVHIRGGEFGGRGLMLMKNKALGLGSLKAKDLKKIADLGRTLTK